ncbi:hypothetical protein BU25DRAFT_439601 [Macroventuria anomochaeta]|uniref:Uncharacterized protein n=1 Tax=Macroventuria anomochaeta TaxID=301207 RepID=A0ACB6S411_9PLEO|nr:uncharacterized protein BU25DRAFT_439601 [Macroventuria anomochaeta]KAF2628124.1 hypothetical protein BU25DRAFT_439601 [Macroventuria anomochaeta]
MGQTRRAHRKSRAGCEECKRRRIKCGEEKPTCAHCTRHLVACVYPSKASVRAKANRDSPLRTTASPATPSQQGTSSSDSYPTSYQSNVAFDSSLYTLSDLALLHHWTTITSPNIVHSPSVNHIWQSGFPQFAFKNGSLMSRILSLAALHRAYLDPANRHSAMLVAGQHHSQAIKGLMDGLQENTGSDSGNAIFANAVLTFLYAFISFGPLYNDEQTGANTAAHTSRILGASWIPLIRGLAPVIEQVQEQVATGPLGSLLDIAKWMELHPGTEDDPDDQHIWRIGDIWRKGDHSSEHADAYSQTLLALRQCNMWLKQSGTWQDDDSPLKANYGPWSGPFIWISITPETYFTLLHQRQPPAMIIFACFGALLHKMNHYWWMEGCGRSIVEAVDQCLGPYWSDWMDWPKQVLQSATPNCLT